MRIVSKIFGVQMMEINGQPEELTTGDLLKKFFLKTTVKGITTGINMNKAFGNFKDAQEMQQKEDAFKAEEEKLEEERSKYEKEYPTLDAKGRAEARAMGAKSATSYAYLKMEKEWEKSTAENKAEMLALIRARIAATNFLVEKGSRVFTSKDAEAQGALQPPRSVQRSMLLSTASAAKQQAPAKADAAEPAPAAEDDADDENAIIIPDF